MENISCRKKVLYIASPFFNIYRHIINEFEHQGYEVDYYNDRPSENSFLKGITKIKKSLVHSIVERYFNNMIAETKDKDYDLVFIMNDKVITPKIMDKLKDSQKNAKFVLYMWDPIQLYPQANKIISYFDVAFSFDSADCAENSALQFLPLFYSKSYEEIDCVKRNDIKYDLVSICTVHPNRYKIIKELFPALEADGVNIYSYMFINRLQYVYNKFFVKAFKKAKKNEFTFTPLPEQENIRMTGSTNAIFDIPHDKQSGLTIRTMEALGAKKKLVTTNANIKNYDFYNENNIYVLDENNRNGIKAFLQREYEAIDDGIYKKYSLRSWLRVILNAVGLESF
ncbi:MAG: hypothetical protein FWE06_05300 [Oscillospiraceae bacterium]|nr:hypothetical protein [Oscillospiraceae bacterium]